MLSPNNDIVNLSLNSINISSSGYTLTGLPISLSGSLNSDTGSSTYDIDTTLVCVPTINDQDGYLTIQSVLSSGGVNFTGGGTVILDAANTYSGNTTINPGVTVDLATSNANLGTGQLILRGTRLPAVPRRRRLTTPSPALCRSCPRSRWPIRSCSRMARALQPTARSSSAAR